MLVIGFGAAFLNMKAPAVLAIGELTVGILTITFTQRNTLGGGTPQSRLLGILVASYAMKGGAEKLINISRKTR